MAGGGWMVGLPTSMVVFGVKKRSYGARSNGTHWQLTTGAQNPLDGVEVSTIEEDPPDPIITPVRDAELLGQGSFSAVIASFTRCCFRTLKRTDEKLAY